MIKYKKIKKILQSRKAGGESGENPELSRNCMGSIIMEFLSQRHDDVRN